MNAIYWDVEAQISRPRSQSGWGVQNIWSMTAQEQEVGLWEQPGRWMAVSIRAITRVMLNRYQTYSTSSGSDQSIDEDDVLDEVWVSDNCSFTIWLMKTGTTTSRRIPPFKAKDTTNCTRRNATIAALRRD